jgi:pyridoxine 4-dehydrogenase
VSNVTPEQLAEAQKITEIVCVPNFYNLAHRNDDVFIIDLTAQGIAYVPFFPLGGFSPYSPECSTQQHHHYGLRL